MSAKTYATENIRNVAVVGPLGHRQDLTGLGHACSTVASVNRLLQGG